MEKCYLCGKESVYWLGDNETDEYFETVYSCNNCGAEIVIYKELEDSAQSTTPA